MPAGNGVLFRAAGLYLFAFLLSSLVADEPLSPAQLRYREAYRLLQAAEQGRTAAERGAGLRATAQELRAALEIDPQHYRARALLAQTAFGLTRELADAAERRQAAALAREQFALAAQLQPTDWRIYNSWGRCLLFLANEEAIAPALLAEARPLFEKARGLARWNSDKATVDNLFGQCLYRSAQHTAAGPEQRRYLEAAIQRLNSATTELPVATDAVAWQTLGNARLELGQLTGDQPLVRAAVSALHEALAAQPNLPDLHFALARAFALLGENESALRHLRSSLDTGVATNLATRAAGEPAFDRLRDQADFQQVLTSGKNVPLAGPFLQNGTEILAQATTAVSVAARRELLERAAECFRRATHLQPDSNPAQTLWAQTLAQLAQTAPARAAGLDYARSADERFALATARAPGDWHTYLVWGQLLTYSAQHFAESPPHRAAQWQLATEKFETGLRQTKMVAARHALQRELAGALLLQASGPGEQAGRLKMLERCLSLCAELAPAKPSAEAGPLYGIWGRALVLAGKLGNARLALRQGTEKLVTALQFDPGNCELQYRLATAYALLENKPQALRHLRDCLNGDSTGTYQRMAGQDRDLDQVRNLPEFNELLGMPQPAPADVFSAPIPLSN